MWMLTVAFILLTAGHEAKEYDNNPKGFLLSICPTNHVVSQIKSTHSGANNDRRWKIGCKPVEGEFDCSWSGQHKLYNEDFNFNCKANHVVGGVFSTYSIRDGGRRWNILCCSTEKFITYECQEAPKVNYWNEDFIWYVPGDNYLTGFRTHSKNSKGDHRWSYNYCKGTKLDTPIVNSKILAINEPLGGKFIEGDVVLRGRNAKVCESCTWPKSGRLVEVPFTMSKSFTSYDESVIQDAMKDFHLNTCVRFVSVKHKTNRISIVKSNGCSSDVGKKGGAQELSLDQSCINKGIIQHELIHALGFWHEQSRTDRDLYVKINYENIRPGKEGNFKRLQTNNLNVPYDYSSVMHYGPKDFTQNGEETITSFEGVIGQRISMSTNDILKINKLYNCKDYLHKYDNWDNEIHGDLRRKCASGQAVSGIVSSHFKLKKDRIWGISCKGFAEFTTCRWSRDVNKYWGPMNFKCANNAVISGVRSERGRVLQDRIWRIYCCSNPAIVTFNCKETPMVNYWEEFFNFPVPGSNFLTGVKSTFNSKTRDRRWKFTYCQIKHR